MTEREAQEVIRMFEANWRLDLGAARALWRGELVKLDAEATKLAVARLARTHQGRPPYLADLIAIVRSSTPKMEAAPVQSIDQEGKRGYATPEWVWVWSWCRFLRNPRIEVWFPQQRDFCDPTEPIMTKDEYETLRNEWVGKGQPKAGTPMAGMPV